jgi:hypothetical protein
MALHDPTTTEEKRGEKLAVLTREAADNLTAALSLGLPDTMQIIDEALGEFMQDDQARPGTQRALCPESRVRK